MSAFAQHDDSDRAMSVSRLLAVVEEIGECRFCVTTTEPEPESDEDEPGTRDLYQLIEDGQVFMACERHWWRAWHNAWHIRPSHNGINTIVAPTAAERAAADA
jgi:hypothetical protein